MDEIAHLVVELNSNDVSRRAAAAEQLSNLGVEARGAAVPLVRAVGDDDEEVSEWASAALEELGPPSPGDVAAFAELLTDGNSDVGYWAATMLGRLEANAATAAAQLADVLSARVDVSVRQRAAWALGKIGSKARTATQALESTAASPDPRLARLSREAIDLIRGGQ